MIGGMINQLIRLVISFSDEVLGWDGEVSIFQKCIILSHSFIGE